jgi:enoyl-CoA hydratase/carnithine racemase
MALATEIASKSPHAIRDAKRLYNESWREPPTTGLPLEAEMQQRLLGSQNQMRAVQASMAKQQAVFDDPE